MKIALIHDWLITYAGAERVLEQMLQCFPEADLFCVVDFIGEAERGFLLNKKSQNTFIQKLPWAKKKYRNYLPLMPVAIEQLDLRGYDLIISSSHAVAKGVLTGPDQLHLSYIHSPMRYAWDLQEEYLEQSGLAQGLKSRLARYLLHRLRRWDLNSSFRVDYLWANSQFIARRIQKFYRREAQVLYPPVYVHRMPFKEQKEDFYVTASRMVPYKRMDLIVEAFSQEGKKRLVVLGDGPEFSKIKAKAKSNVELLGYQKTEVLKDYLSRAKAFVFAAEEDFGILPVEAQACGTPVIAFGKGGALETVRGLGLEQPTGVFFEEQSVKSLLKAVELFESKLSQIRPQDCLAQASQFSEEKFRHDFLASVKDLWSSFHSSKTSTLKPLPSLVSK